jgi:hypothetical protein
MNEICVYYYYLDVNNTKIIQSKYKETKIDNDLFKDDNEENKELFKEYVIISEKDFEDLISTAKNKSKIPYWEIEMWIYDIYRDYMQQNKRKKNNVTFDYTLFIEEETNSYEMTLSNKDYLIGSETTFGFR